MSKTVLSGRISAESYRTNPTLTVRYHASPVGTELHPRGEGAGTYDQKVGPVNRIRLIDRSADSPRDIDTPHWFAVRTSLRWEFRASSELSSRGVETYLPQSSARRQWSDRSKLVDQPLFPGYLFSRFHLADRVRILQVPGVKQIVGVGNTPQPISVHQLDHLRTLVAANTGLVPWPYLNTGQRIQIDRGPLTGVKGFVVRAEQGALRIVVSLDLLQRSVAAVIDRDSIGVVE
jgi:transcriptional antiterminator NusG